MSDPLLKAKTADEVLAALAHACWAKANAGDACPRHRIPTPETLARWDVERDRGEGKGMILTETRHIEAFLDVPSEIVADWPVLWTGILTERVERLQELWCTMVGEAEDKADTPKHPLAPLIDAWQRLAPVPIHTRNDRPDPLFPAPLVHVKRNDRRAANLFSPATWADTRKGQIDLFPGFGPSQADGPLVPALPLALYDLGKGAKMTRGHGAPLALRIFVEAVLSVGLEDRDRAVLLPPQRFGDFLAALYPDHAPNYRPKKDWPRFLEATAALDAARIPWENEDGTGALRRVVYARDLPREGSRDDWIQFAVDIPPGVGKRGALVDRAALRLTGVVSALAYRLTLSLAFWWNDPGRTRTPTNKGGGRGKLWRQTRKPERYPEVTDAELIAMAYPRDAGDVDTGRRMRLHRAREALAYLVSIGYAEVHPRQRIMPGRDWAGWDATE